jgi:hypothetical protein
MGASMAHHQSGQQESSGIKSSTGTTCQTLDSGRLSLVACALVLGVVTERAVAHRLVGEDAKVLQTLTMQRLENATQP